MYKMNKTPCGIPSNLTNDSSPTRYFSGTAIKRSNK
jgi:hypothetical protein